MFVQHLSQRSWAESAGATVINKQTIGDIHLGIYELLQRPISYVHLAFT